MKKKVTKKTLIVDNHARKWIKEWSETAITKARHKRRPRLVVARQTWELGEVTMELTMNERMKGNSRYYSARSLLRSYRFSPIPALQGLRYYIHISN